MSVDHAVLQFCSECMQNMQQVIVVFLVVVFALHVPGLLRSCRSAGYIGTAGL